MFITNSIISLAFVVVSTQAGPNRLSTREVPQEHSHNQFLNTVKTSLLINNPLKIIDPVFGLVIHFHFLKVFNFEFFSSLYYLLVRFLTYFLSLPGYSDF